MLYLITSISDYKKMFLHLCVAGATNYLNNEVPFFETTNNLLDFFEPENDVDALYDADGFPLWDTDKEIVPDSFLEQACLKRMENLDLEFPFFVVVIGDADYDRGVAIGLRIIKEIQEPVLLNQGDFDGDQS